jgi:hypothetical protein
MTTLVTGCFDAEIEARRAVRVLARAGIPAAFLGRLAAAGAAYAYRDEPLVVAANVERRNDEAVAMDALQKLGAVELKRIESNGAWTRP